MFGCAGVPNALSMFSESFGSRVRMPEYRVRDFLHRQEGDPRPRELLLAYSQVPVKFAALKQCRWKRWGERGRVVGKHAKSFDEPEPRRNQAFEEPNLRPVLPHGRSANVLLPVRRQEDQCFIGFTKRNGPAPVLGFNHKDAKRGDRQVINLCGRKRTIGRMNENEAIENQPVIATQTRKVSLKIGKHQTFPFLTAPCGIRRARP
jgi:hypothetical protein